MRASTVQVDHLEGEQKKTFDMIEARIADYRDACQYLMSSDRARAMDMLKIAENFKRLQEAIAKGKKIDILKVEPPVSPEILLGYSEAERQKSKLAFFHILFRVRRPDQRVHSRPRGVEGES